jgi:GDP-D-mannose dehydratase
MQWLMLQQQPEDFVIATGLQSSMCNSFNAAARELGMEVRWAGQDVEGKGYWNASDDDKLIVASTRATPASPKLGPFRASRSRPKPNSAARPKPPSRKR